MINNCNCPEKVECGCTLSFSSYVTPSVSVLDVGTLVSSGCTIIDYVIDWYRNGEWYMTTASSYAVYPEADGFHPFTGTGALPVIGGTYTAKVRFVVIGGEIIFAEPKPCQKWCDMPLTLPPIIVSSLSCASVNQTGNYQYSINYLSSQDYSLASRLFTVELDSNIKQFGWYFLGKTIADRIEIYHSRTGEKLADWVVGSELPHSNFTDFPHLGGWMTDEKGFFNLPKYQDGDSLTIKITPNYLGNSSNTEWTFSYKCLATEITGPSGIVKASREYDIDTMEMYWDAAQCSFIFRCQFVGAFPVVSQAFYNYSGLAASAVNCFHSSAGNYYGGRLYYAIGATYVYRTTYLTKQTTSGITINKTGNIYTITFLEESKYLTAKSNYATLKASTHYTGWNSDPTNINYYRFFYFYWGQTAISCGDNEVRNSYYFFIRDDVTFDDVLQKATITAQNITNQLPADGDCMDVKSYVNAYLSYVARDYGLADFSMTSKCFYTEMFQLYFCFTGISLPRTYTLNTCGYAYFAYGIDLDPYGIVSAENGWCIYTGDVDSSYRNYFYMFAWQLYITATRDEYGNWITDPEKNWYVMETTYTPCWSSTRKIFEMVDGIVTYKRYWDGN